MRKLLVGASVLALVAGPALAQKTTPPPKAVVAGAPTAPPASMTEAEANKALVDQFAKILVNDERSMMMLQSQVRSLTADLALARGNADATKKELAKARTDATQAKAAADRQIASLKADAEKTRAEVATSNKDLAQAKQQLAAVRDELQRTKAGEPTYRAPHPRTTTPGQRPEK